MAKFTTVFLVPLLILAGFLFPNYLRAQEAPLLINQIQIASETSTKHDFIKIYNPNDFEVDLQGYRLVKRTKTGTSDTTIKSFNTSVIIAPRASLTWANSEDGFANSINADFSTGQTIASDNAIALRFGPEDTGTIIDAVAWGEANNGLVETSNFPTNPEAGQQLTRINFQDNNNNSQDFSLNTNSTSNPTTVANSSTANSEASSPSPSISYRGLVFLNEVVSSPESGSSEWVELFNNTASPINLQDWTLEDGSGAKTILKDIITK